MSRGESYSDNIQNVVSTFAGVAQARNRQVTALIGTAETVTWNSGINEVTLTVINEASTTPTLNSVGVCFGAPTDAAAAAWLTYAESKTADTNMVVLLSGVPRTFYFSGSGIVRLDMKRIFGSDALGVLVEAA